MCSEEWLAELGREARGAWAWGWGDLPICGDAVAWFLPWFIVSVDRKPSQDRS